MKLSLFLLQYNGAPDVMNPWIFVWFPWFWGLPCTGVHVLCVKIR